MRATPGRASRPGSRQLPAPAAGDRTLHGAPRAPAWRSRGARRRCGDRRGSAPAACSPRPPRGGQMRRTARRAAPPAAYAWIACDTARDPVSPGSLGDDHRPPHAVRRGVEGAHVPECALLPEGVRELAALLGLRVEALERDVVLVVVARGPVPGDGRALLDVDRLGRELV